MDVRDIRRNNLLLLLAEYPEFGSISAFAKDVGAAPNHLSQILSEKIKITMGNTMARRIEEKKPKTRTMPYRSRHGADPQQPH